MSDASTQFDDVEMSVRLANGLQQWLGEHATLGELAEHTEEEFLRRRNLGRRTLTEAREILRRADLAFAERKTITPGVVAKLQRELVEARAVLVDLLHDRGESWLTQLVGRREELYGRLRNAERVGGDYLCPECDYDADDGRHEARCRLAGLLRIVGGPEETQRQVDAAHEAALEMRRARQLTNFANGLDIDFAQRLVDVGALSPEAAAFRGGLGDWLRANPPRVTFEGRPRLADQFRNWAVLTDGDDK